VTDSHSYDDNYSTKNELYNDEMYGSKSGSKTYDFALKYLENDLSIFPIPKPDSRSNKDGTAYDGKIPCIRWTEFQNRKAEHEEIEAWFRNHENNIAIVTGKTSSVFVIDIDGERSKQVFESQVLGRLSGGLQNAIKSTMKVITGGGGQHFYIRFKLDDFPDGINSKKYLVLGEHDEIAIKGNGGYVVAPPSIHASGKSYELMSDELVALSKEHVIELLNSLDSLKYIEDTSISSSSSSRSENLSLIKLDTERITRIVNLVKSCYSKGSRNDIVFALSGYLHRRYVSVRSILDTIGYLAEDDEKKSSRIQVAGDTCNKPRDSNEVSGYKRLVEVLSLAMGSQIDAKEMISEINTIINQATIEQGFKVPYNNNTTKTNTFSSSLEDQLSPYLISELSRHTYKFTRYNPLQLTIAHCDEKKIFHAYVNYVKNDNNKDIDGSSTEYLKLTDVIIDAIPKQVILFDNSIDRNRKVQIQFESKSTKRTFTIGPGSISTLVEELQNRNMLIKKAAAMDALTAIISAFERDDKAIINDNITTPGYYFMDGKIVTYEITQHINKYPEQDEILQCVNLLDELSQKYKNKDIFPSVMKWAVVSPFSFILKGTDNWMPWLQPYGITKSGKSTLGIIALAVWRKHKSTDKKDHQLGFNNIDSVARFGNAISKSTYPVLANEAGGLTNEKFNFIVEMIKHAVENQTARGKFVDGSYNNIPALSPFILTANYSPPSDPAYRRRVLLLHFAKEELHQEKEANEFKQWLSENIDILGTLGDFAAKYVIDHPDVLATKQWEDIAKIILTELYKTAGKEAPSWLNYLVEQKVIEETSEETHFELRAFLMDIITNAYSRHIKTLTPNQEVVLDISFTSRLNFCLDNELIPFLHKHINRNNQSEIAITADIFTELKKRKIENLTHLRDLGNELGFEYCQRKIGGRQTKVVCGDRNKFIKFLDGIMEDTNNN
jgi:hypothetical protein